MPPRSGRRHTLRLIREMLAFEPQSKGTDIDLALRETLQVLKKKSVVFLLSDLITDRPFENSLKILNRKHDCVALQIFDPIEHRWPSGLPVVVEDAETGELLTFPGGSRSLARLDAELEAERRERRELCRRSRVDLVEIESGKDVLPPVIDFFARRRNRQGR